MNSETPKEHAPKEHAAGHNDGAGQSSAPQGRETPGSIGLELLEQHDDFDIHGGGDVFGDNDDGINTLMAHERKLSAGEQRTLLAMRRRAIDDDPEEQVEMQSGRRHLLWQMHNAKHGDAMSPMSATNIPGQAAEPATDTAPATPALLNDAANPDKPMYDAVLKGVNGLDPARITLTAEEQANVAGALTASMAQTPGFNRATMDFSSMTIALSENGDRLFLINHQNPGAPDALRASVALDTARAQTLEASSGQMLVAQTVEPQQKPSLEQTVPGEQPLIAPRSIA
jgi:hypothetical protein